MNAHTRVPCTIITGFLGSGKTTLIRHLIETAHGRRLAIIVNEFGDVGVDGAILGECGADACPRDNIVELANGCICCTVASDFAPAIDRILALTPPVEHILIETSGLALPKPLVQAFQWPNIKSRVTVDGVIAVADGQALAQGRVAADPQALAAQRAADSSLDHDDPVEEVFEDQIACADLVVLSKCDLLDASARAQARAQLNGHRLAGVKIIESSGGAVDPSVVLGLGLAVENDIDLRKTHHDDELDHEHDDFDSFVLEIDPVANVDAFIARVKAAGALPHVLRIKGFLEASQKPMRLAVQGVGPRVSHYYDRLWQSGEVRRSSLVVIGLRGLDRNAVAALITD